MNVLYASNEVVPFAKVGGLADVAGTLPAALTERGLDVRVVMPLHRSCLRHGPFELICPSMEVVLGAETLEASILEGRLPDGKTPIYFIKYDPFFNRAEVYGESGTDYPDSAERYAFFCSAALQLPQAIGFVPDLVHANDWMTGLIPLFARRVDPIPPTLYTIHNLAYQGVYPEEKAAAIGVLWDPESRHQGYINFMATGIRCATQVSTVSARYAEEIQTPEFGNGLEGLLAERAAHLSGILNGIDYQLWNPLTDPALPHHYGRGKLTGKAHCKAALQEGMNLPREPLVPLVGCVNRLVAQKGLDILAEVIEQALKLPMQFVILGSGQPDLERRYLDLAAAYPNQVAVKIGFDDILARHIYAGADLFAMPSRYEPCGLGQMIAMAYGTVPVVRYTGGLADTVTEAGPRQTGFVHYSLDPADVLAALQRAVTLYADRRRWVAIVNRCIAQDFSWATSAQRYEELYTATIAKAAQI
ncbi:MAG: glycogen synthase [Candidatus Zipacnadales bacterium]